MNKARMIRALIQDILAACMGTKCTNYIVNDGIPIVEYFLKSIQPSPTSDTELADSIFVLHFKGINLDTVNIDKMHDEVAALISAHDNKEIERLGEVITRLKNKAYFDDIRPIEQVNIVQRERIAELEKALGDIESIIVVANTRSEQAMTTIRGCQIIKNAIKIILDCAQTAIEGKE